MICISYIILIWKQPYIHSIAKGTRIFFHFYRFQLNSVHIALNNCHCKISLLTYNCSFDHLSCGNIANKGRWFDSQLLQYGWDLKWRSCLDDLLACKILNINIYCNLNHTFLHVFVSFSARVALYFVYIYLYSTLRASWKISCIAKCCQPHKIKTLHTYLLCFL